MDVRVHLLGNGVKVALNNQSSPEGSVDLQGLLTELMECGLVVSACGMSLDNCAIDEASMIKDIERSSMKALANYVKNSDQVMVF